MGNEFTILLPQIETLIISGPDRNEILLNICNLLKSSVFHYDWVGFYISDANNTVLILGPFCGKSTQHTVIPFGKGICGQVAEGKKLKIVRDVSLERNYIACSLEVQSEIVVPVLKDNKFMAEIDIDSHSPAPFTEDDEEFLTLVCQKLAVLF